MMLMNKESHNPWKWQDRFGFSQAWTVTNPETIVEISGQTSMSAEGDVLHMDDFEKQVETALQNLETVLEEAGATINDVVKIGAYLTDQKHMESYRRVQSEFFGDFNPAQTLLIVEDLALPDLMVEVEATAYVGPE